VIAIDTNILVYAHRSETPHFTKASALIRSLAEGRSSWAIPWPCLHEFLAVITHPRIHKTPTPVEVAFRQVDIWLRSPTLALLTESDRHWSQLRGLITAGRIVGPRVHDARVAAICLEHGVRELWTADRDFSRFPNLNAVNPLIV